MFWDRYLELCKRDGVRPTRAALDAGLSKGSVNNWKQSYLKGIDAQPSASTARKLAEYFHVSVDYLLNETDDPTDYEDGDLLADIAGAQYDALGGDARQTVKVKQMTDLDAMKERENSRRIPEFVKQYSRLDERDQDKVDSFIAGLLAGDKYKRENNANLASS